MATIKSFSDLQQSKKLADILSHESADGHWYNSSLGLTYSQEAKDFYETTNNEYLPAWSLSALISVLPKIHKLKPILDLEENSIQYSGIDLYVVADNLIDACVAIIERLHELNLL